MTDLQLSMALIQVFAHNHFVSENVVAKIGGIVG